MGLDPLSLGIGLLGMQLLGGGKTPNVAAPPPPPQASKAPDAASVVQGVAGAGQAGGSPGIAQTFLTGPNGIDPNLLKLGKNTLLGG